MSILGAAACGGGSSNAAGAPAPDTAPASSERKYLLERVGDAAVVQLYADGFRDLPLAEKTLIWHLYQAALAGRDIFYDQKHARSLEMRDVLEAIIAAPGIEPATLRGDPPVHEAVLDQQRSVQQQERAQVRVDVHP